jgi:protein-S-isoprenylcysteine O-methyltransferase Ste14
MPAMRPTLRWLRLRAVWLLVIPFMWLSRPTPQLLAAGGVLVAVGLAIRTWAAGVIRKERELTTEGPYGHTRNPLYVGSFFLGVGVTLAGGHWAFVALFLVFFALVYGRTIRGEARLLEEAFGDEYRVYARAVPLVVPRLTRYRRVGATGAFTLERWRKNREYEALVGAVAGLAFLAARMFWP